MSRFLQITERDLLCSPKGPRRVDDLLKSVSAAAVKAALGENRPENLPLDPDSGKAQRQRVEAVADITTQRMVRRVAYFRHRFPCLREQVVGRPQSPSKSTKG